MRIVHVTPYFAPAFMYGGPPRSVLGLCRALRRAGADVTVVTTTANGAKELPAAMSSQTSFEGVPVTYVPRSFPRRTFRAAGLVAALERVASGCDLVHVHGCWNAFGWSAERWCRGTGLPYVISPRGMLDRWSFQSGRLRKWTAYRLMERRGLSRARLLHATTERESADIARLGLGVDTVVVPNGLEELIPLASREREAFRAKFGFGPDHFVMLFLGRLHPTKNLGTLFEAMRMVGDRQPDVRLLVAGAGDARYVASLEDAARDLIEAGRVRFAGHLVDEDRRSAFGSADAFASTSHSENFGMSVAEAIGSGLPVVVTRGCPWPEIETWRAGFWVENAPRAVADAIGSLAANRSEASAMGERGRAAIRACLGWDRLAADMLQAYSRALKTA